MGLIVSTPQVILPFMKVTVLVALLSPILVSLLLVVSAPCSRMASPSWSEV